MVNITDKVVLPALCALGLVLAGCGKGVSEASKVESYALKGVIKGLDGAGLVITNTIDGNVKDTLTFDAPNILLGGDVQDIPFTFTSTVENGNQYSIAVGKQPVERFQTCEVKNPSGQVANSDITNIEINCATRKFPVGGSVQGLLAGSTLTVRNSNNEAVTLSSDAEFTFPSEILSGDAYVVNALVSAPSTFPDQLCSVSNNRGTVRDIAISSLVVTCATSWHQLRAQVNGLRDNSVLLRSDVAGDLLVEGSGTINTQFKAAVPKGADYTVLVKSNPTDPYQECSFPTEENAKSKATGKVTDADVVINVNCADKPFYVRGVVNGLSANGLRLRNNANDLVEINLPAGKPAGSAVTFQFEKPLISNDSYSVLIDQQPGSSQTCTISANNGTIVNHDVTVVVNCEANSYILGGTVSGLSPQGTGLILANGQNTVTINANGSFSFLAPVRGGTDYDVVVDTAPRNPSQTCTVTRGKGTMGSSNVNDIVVNCKVNRFSVGGTVAGLAANAQITLQNNNGDDLIVGANGAFRFGTDILSGDAYSVTVLEQPSNQLCGVSKASGNVGNGRVSNVEINCITSYTLSGTVKGLLSGRSITLQDTRGGMYTVRSPNADFALSSMYFSGNSYNVSVATQPAGETCTVSGGSGVMGSANVTSIVVNCAPNSYVLKVSVAGYSGTGLVLKNNSTTLTLNADNTVAQSVASGTDYNFSLDTTTTNPIQSCSFPDNNNRGTMVDRDINISVQCTGVKHTVGGSIRGLLRGRSVTLQDTQGGNVTVSNPNGVTTALDFSLSTLYSPNDLFNISVATQPTGETCSVTGGNGTMGGATVSSVVVDCTPNNYVVKVTVTGYSGTGLVLRNGTASLTLGADNTVSQTLASGTAYTITLDASATNPPHTCSFTSNNTQGTLLDQNVNIAVGCAAVKHTVGGSVNGLIRGRSLVLQDTLGGSTTVSNPNGLTSAIAFALGTQYAPNETYNISVATQPDGQTCTLSGNSGTMAGANVNTVGVSCSPNTYRISGTISGVNGTGLAITNNNAAVTLANGANATTKTFALDLSSGTAYNIQISATPTNPAQTCAFTTTSGASSGTVFNSNIAIAIQCTDVTYSIGGTINGYSGSGLTLNLNNVATPFTVTGNTFTFTNRLNYSDSYAVTVGTQPTTQKCSVTNGAGKVNAQNINSVQISCADLRTLGGIVSGLATGNSVELLSSTGERLTVSSNAQFNFTTKVAAGEGYGVGVSRQPISTSQSCTVISGGSGVVSTVNVGDVRVQCGLNWQWARPSPQGNHLRGVAWNGLSGAASRFVAVGDEGSIVTSTDSVTWTRRNLGVRSNFTSITWKPPSTAGGTDGMFLAVASGSYATSPDGINWTIRNFNLTNFGSANSVVWTGSQFVATSTSYFYYATSLDGITWTQRNGISYSKQVISAGDKLVVIGQNGNSIQVSSDGGTTWTNTTVNGYLSAIAYKPATNAAGTNGLLVAVGYTYLGPPTYAQQNYVITSNDGVNWTSQSAGTVNNNLTAVTWTGSNFVALGSSGVLLDGGADGLIWTGNSIGVQYSPNYVATFGTVLIAVGMSGAILTSSSADIAAWQSRVNFVSNNNNINTWSSIHWNGAQLVLAGNTSVTTGTSVSTLATASSSVPFYISSMAYSDTLSRYVATGNYGQVYYSSDAKTWTSTTSGMSYPGKVIWANGKFVIVAYEYTGIQPYYYGGKVFTSADGITWTAQNPNTPQSTLSGICWTGSQYVAVGANGAVTTSPDGAAWTAQTSITTQALSRVACNGSFVVAVGANDTILTSADSGVTWASRYSNINNNITTNLSDVVWTGTRYIAVGTGGKVMTSTNGTQWVVESSGSEFDFYGIVWTGTQAVAIGTYGSVLYTQ